MKDVLPSDEVREILRDSFYAPASKRGARAAGRSQRRRAKPKHDHYEVICISMYKDDLARLDAAVEKLKARGHRKMSRSALIRFALDTMDLGKLPKSY